MSQSTWLPPLPPSKNTCWYEIERSAGIVFTSFESQTSLPVCRLASKIRSQSPSNSQQYHYSPTRHRPPSSTGEKKADGKNVEKQKSTDNNSMHPSSQAETNVPRSCRGQSLDKHVRGNTSENEKNQSPDRKQLMAPIVDSSEKKMLANAQNDDKKKGRLRRTCSDFATCKEYLRCTSLSTCCI